MQYYLIIAEILTVKFKQTGNITFNVILRGICLIVFTADKQKVLHTSMCL